MLRVTVGISFHNSERTLADAIRSVFAQTYHDWELLLVDDGSSDSSLHIARSVNDPRVKVISDGENFGLQQRLNQITSLSQGEYIARMDADDIMHPERLQTQVDFLDNNPEVHVVGSAIYIIDSDNNVTGTRLTGRADLRPKHVIKYGLMCHPSITGRSEWFRCNPYNENFSRAEDYELWCRTCATSNFARIDQPLLYYREGYKTPLSYLRYYLEDAAYCRKCLTMHGPSITGWPLTVLLIARTFVKSAVYCAATVSGLQTAVIKRRAECLDNRYLAHSMLGLETVQTTGVPGLTAIEVYR